MARPTRKTGPKKAKKNVPSGVAHIQSTFNNTIVTISDIRGDVISWASAGSSGFKGAKKGTPYAAQTAADSAARRAMEQGMRQLEVMVSGPGAWPGNGDPCPPGSWFRNYLDQRCYPHSPQWLSSPQTPSGLGQLGYSNISFFEQITISSD